MAAGPVPGTSPFAGHPPQGDDADTAVRHARSTQTRATARHRTGVFTNVRDHFHGQAGTVLRAEFDDCGVSVGPGTTTLRAELPDQGALHGLLQRIVGLRLELIDVHVAAPPSGSDRCSRPRLPRCPRVASTRLGFPPVSVRARHVPVRAAASPVGVASRSAYSACARSSASSGSSPASDRGPVDCGQRVRLHGPWGQPEVAAACAVHQSAGSISPCLPGAG
jgi:hypothetical protein